jgi:uncharacterized protein (DUF1330 family)
MAKAYLVLCYHAVHDDEALQAYAKLAMPAIQAAGGRYLARGRPAKTYEAGLHERTVLIEFDSIEQAVAAHDSPAYQEALKSLGNGAKRDVRIVEGVS